MRGWIEILIRSFGLFFFTFLLIRVMGKKSPYKMTSFQLVSYLVISTLVALISVGVVKNLQLALVTLAVWIVMSIVIDFLTAKNKMLHDFVYGKETVLIKEGKIMEENLRKTKLTGDELIRELRTKNAFSIADVEFAILETTGEVNVFMKSDKKPITSHDLGKKVSPQVEPQTIILDGNIDHDALAAVGLNVGWLKKQLKSMSIDLTNVFMGQVDSNGDLYIDLFDDILQQPQPTIKEMLYANMEKSHADFVKYPLETKDKEAKRMYEYNAERLEILMKKLKPYLLH